ncbi:hypothetical protein R6Q59_006633 [Mikania micrantha]
MPIYTSSEVGESNNRSILGRERSLHAIFGGGSVADILLWRNKSLSASILFGFTIIWYLFEVVKYTFVSLVCHFLILVMLMVFITYTASKYTVWIESLLLFLCTPMLYALIFHNLDFADTNEITIQDYVTRWLYRKLYHIILRFYEISSGENLIEFLVVILVLWITSVIGNYFSLLNLLFFSVICLGTIPALYEGYENSKRDRSSD